MKTNGEFKVKIEQVKVGILKPAKYNPRVWNESQTNGLKASIAEFGIVDPIIVNSNNKRKNIVIGGHFRLHIAKQLGYKEVPVVYVDLNEKKEKALNVALNNPHIAGDWTAGLEVLLNDIKLDLPDLFLDLNLDSLIDDIPEIPETEVTGNTDPDAIPETPEEPIIKTGDLITLGKHRILCGDSTKKEDVERLMAEEKADMVFTDPPYGIGLDTDNTGIMGRGKKYKKIIGDDKKFNPAHIFQMFNCKEIFLWGANYYADLLPDLLNCGWFVWDKQHSDEDGNSHTGNFFELCWSREKHKYQVIKKEWFRFYGLATQDIKKRVHPTQKPIEVCVWFINKFSKDNQIIADIFLGSGSTLIACEMTTRRCFGIEIDPGYVETCILRYGLFVGSEEEIVIERDGQKYGWEEIQH